MDPVTQTSVPCPGCGVAIVALSDNGAMFGGCLGCGGMFLDNAACKQLMDGALSETAREFGRAITTRGAAAATGSAYRQATGARTCPACAGALKAVRLRSPSIELDVCPTHGAYLDRGEFGAIWLEASVRAAELDVAGGEIKQQLDAERIGRLLDTFGVNPLLRH